MNKQALLKRTTTCARRVIKTVQALPQDDVPAIIGRQLLSAETSGGANCRAACRAKSPADFPNKLKIAEEGCDESMYWTGLLIDAGSRPLPRLEAFLKERDELVAIFVSASKTTRAGRHSQFAILKP